jgi:hypothetical protein
MGSAIDLPDASSPNLALVNPTEAEKNRIWSSNFAEWGGALCQTEYVDREKFLGTIPLAENGGMINWVLTDSSAPGENRLVLASCETLRKKVLVTDAQSGELREATAYGIGSVYTDPQLRGRQYASRMLQELGRILEKGLEEKESGIVKPVASTLWSDIGKVFYAKKGWAPFESVHVAFPAGAAVSHDANEQPVGEITYENLEAFCKLDERLLRKHLATRAPDGKTRFAFIPNHDILRWHLYREDFIAKHVFKGQKQTDVKGAVAGAEGSRIWAVWMRNYAGGATEIKKNTLYILRLVVEDDTAPHKDLTASFVAILRKAQAEAVQWKLGKIELWNPTPVIKSLVETSEVEHKWVDREKDSIPSLMWYGESDASQIDWVANEKFCWS